MMRIVAAAMLSLATASAQPDILRDLLAGPGTPQLDRALAAIEERPDRRFIAPLIDLLPFTREPRTHGAIAAVLRKLTNTEVIQWEDLMMWYGANDLKPPAGYTAWKGELLARAVDPRMREFLYEGAPATVRVEEVVWGGVKVDGIPALVNPRMVPAATASSYLVDSEPVFGVSLGGDTRAYPLRILDWHEMANDVVGGRPVALAYCTLCGAGVLYDATAGGQTFEFGSSGLLMRSNKLMYDRATRTLWNQLTGEPVIGKLAGQGIKLSVLPVVLTSWGEWRKRHPATRAVDLATGHSRAYLPGATYGAYFASPRTMFPVWKQSKALPMKARVFAIVVEGVPKAYPLDALARAGGVVNDTVGSAALVVVSSVTVATAPLPAEWQSALRGRKPTLDNARSALRKDPGLAALLTEDVLLSMPVEIRLPLLAE
ncbi:MAG: DUF3179 domain-containing protein, partial [Bryobacteraceae bacterium]